MGQKEMGTGQKSSEEHLNVYNVLNSFIKKVKLWL